MNINYKIVAGVLAAGWAYEAYANIDNAKRAYSARKKYAELVVYMADVLDKNEIPLDEFDLIAMKEIAKK